MHLGNIKNFYVNVTGKHQRQITSSECQEVSLPGTLTVGKMLILDTQREYICLFSAPSEKSKGHFSNAFEYLQGQVCAKPRTSAWAGLTSHWPSLVDADTSAHCNGWGPLLTCRTRAILVARY